MFEFNNIYCKNALKIRIFCGQVFKLLSVYFSANDLFSLYLFFPCHELVLQIIAFNRCIPMCTYLG